ncbi:MAG: leucine--tRNA ligase [Flavobacteriales bacterium]|nr:leucine--tRNA ligase [Flavobacteriales bacterium]
MEYNFREIEKKWIKFWSENKSYKTVEDKSKEKYYVLDMFPYPSGAGLHVGHPLGYIASDVIARYKKLEGYNVLHPMGYDSFGLPAEQYAIQTGQHPAVTTDKNIERYRDQLNQMGFCYDWDRAVKTSSPEYYKWTQWIFKQLFNSFYDLKEGCTKDIQVLVSHFDASGSAGIQAYHDEHIEFSSSEWNNFDRKQKEEILQSYRIAYLSESQVNWCPKLGTVLANDEISNGLSVRGGYPVEQKVMKQWSMRIKAFAERLLNDLDQLDWSDSLKEQQRNWIGKSQGASVSFQVSNSNDRKIEVFTTRPDTIFGVTFIVLAPEHEMVLDIVGEAQKEAVTSYIEKTANRSERDRQSDVKNITGEFTGAYALHPFTGKEIPIWIGDYVLSTYGTGAVMSVPCGDQRDYLFAQKFDIQIDNIFKDTDISNCAHEEKSGVITGSDFLNDLEVQQAITRSIQEIESSGIGRGKTNYRLRDAVFSRQRYWGEPFPIYFVDETPFLVDDEKLPIELPEVDKYLPTEEGEPPLARAQKNQWNHFQGDRMDFNTMPGWAGSSWYFLRYMDPHNEKEFVSKEKVDYWQNVDLYIGGSEHATGHLLYSRFWTKCLFDLKFIPFEEPFKKLINQGMILGRSNFVYRINGTNSFVTKDKRKEHDTTAIHVDISIVDNDILDQEKFKHWLPEYKDATFILDDNGNYLCGYEVEKMSKSKFNVQTPDDLVVDYGADTLRLYEMFLGPIEQSKPWDTKGISGVHNFLRKCWRLYCSSDGISIVSNEKPSKDSMKTLHKTIKRIREDLNRFSLNTCVSTFMIAVNEFTEQKCHSKEVLEQFIILLAPYAPHFCEELWEKAGHTPGSLYDSQFPVFKEEYLIEEAYEYPVSFNGKMRFKVELPLTLKQDEIKTALEEMELTAKWLDGKEPKKVIIVPGKIINFVV